ncbi:MAG: pantoate--beta-alanine ligase [Bacteroides sp. SM23_62_1]|nr:MAG: pantoate--beta-alanine ligase [Bacteroides sp. SM23_62_1]
MLHNVEKNPCKIEEIRKILKSIRDKDKTVGLVPTMGALHGGHLSLIDACLATNDVTVVSIFVNPTQFNDKTDFEKYPRDIKNDLKLIREKKCNITFIPSETEIYPERDTRQFDFGLLDKYMEGKFRPGHFRSVAQVVSRLLSIILPDNAYFGEKDFQQLVIVNSLVRQLNLPVNIIACPIIREPDGLAMSSRNQLLTAAQRKSAARISSTLLKAKELSDKMEITELKEYVNNEINLDPNLKTEYFEIVEETGLNPVNSWSENVSKRGCIAVRIGSIRLIDNIKFS